MKLNKNKTQAILIRWHNLTEMEKIPAAGINIKVTIKELINGVVFEGMDCINVIELIEVNNHYLAILRFELP